MADEETQLEIKTDLGPEQVKLRIQDIMIGPSERQTQYHQKWIGHIKGDLVEFSSIYSGRTVIHYKLLLYPDQKGTRIRLTNTVYQNRQMAVGIFKGFGFSFGGIPFIAGIVFYNGLPVLVITAFVSAIVLLLAALAKAEPLSQDEFLSDREVKILLKTIKGHCLI